MPKLLLFGVETEVFDTGEVYVITRRTDYLDRTFRIEYFGKHGKPAKQLLKRAHELQELLRSTPAT